MPEFGSKARPNKTLHRTRTPLTIWFAAAWYVTTAKNGVSAKTLHRLLGFGSYQTAWTMLHRFRTAMVRPGRDRLAGEVEVDETLIGGIKAGKRGRGAHGKALVAVAVESLNPKGFGRCRLRTIPDAEAATLRSFLLDCVEPGSVIVTDGFASYPSAIDDDYGHRPFPVAGSGIQAHVVLPGVHRVASLVKRWLLGTHQGAVARDHLQAYLDEFAFRFNRRRSEFRDLIPLIPPRTQTGEEPKLSSTGSTSTGRSSTELLCSTNGADGSDSMWMFARGPTAGRSARDAAAADPGTTR